MLLSKSRTYPLAFDDAWEAVLSTPLQEWLTRWHLAIPPVKAVSGQEGEWPGHVGQTRSLHLGDGSGALETAVTVERPTRFQYELTEITGPMKALVAKVLGTFDFEPAGTGTRVTWSWEVTPAQPLGGPVMPLFGWMWDGMATRALADLEPRLVP